MSDPNPQRDADLIRRLGPGLVLCARQWCRSGEDVVQDAFLKLFRQQVHPENVSAWLYRVVRHDAMNAGRADSRRFRHERLASENREVWFDPAPGQSLDIETITDSLRAQPLELRETIVAQLWGGLSFDEIAVLTGTSPSTALRRGDEFHSLDVQPIVFPGSSRISETHRNQPTNLQWQRELIRDVPSSTRANT